MIAVAICPKCSEIRARSTREYQHGERVNPDDFEPVGDQPQPRHDAPASCYACGASLAIRFASEGALNGASPEHAQQQTERNRSPVPDLHEGSAVVTLFAAVAGEEVKEIKTLGTRLLVITNRRIVIVNPEEAL